MISIPGQNNYNYNTNLPTQDQTTQININKVTDITGNTSNMGGFGTNTGGEGLMGGGNKSEKSKNSHTDEICIYTNM